jgi:hypothetical protein
MIDDNFEASCQKADGHVMQRLVGRCRALEKRVRLGLGAAGCAAAGLNADAGVDKYAAGIDTVLDAYGAPVYPFEQHAYMRRNLAAARVALGAVLEAVIADCALSVVQPGQTYRQNHGQSHHLPDKMTQLKLARIYSDSFKISLWTSANAYFVSMMNIGIETPHAPCIFSVPSSATEFDWSDVFSRRSLPRQTGNKLTQPLLNLFMRCTNPGCRGWNSLLQGALEDSVSIRMIVGTSATIAMSGMHECIHPATRPVWSRRVKIFQLAQHMTGSADFRKMVVNTAQYTKELLRRTLASSMHACPAMQKALLVVSHPVGLLTLPPASLPSKGLEGAMSAFVTAGLEMQQSGKMCYDVMVKDAFRLHNDETLHADADADGDIDMEAVDSAAGASARAGGCRAMWNVAWLGKGTASIHQKIPLVDIAADIWSAAFRTNFIVFWSHALTHKLRLSRLDKVPYRAMHALNTCTQLVAMLNESAALRAQRAALACPSAGIFTIEEVAVRLGIKGMRGGSSNGGAKNVLDALNTLSCKGSETLAMMLTYARMAWASEEILVVELGKRTAGMQVKALHRRLQSDASTMEALGPPESIDPVETTRDLPPHAVNLLVCTECRRIANAHADISASPLTFNELGVSSSMLCYECNSTKTHVRCSKRSSAALRSAIHFQDEMQMHRIEDMQFNVDNVNKIIHQTSNSISASSLSNDSGVAARIRRDAKSALEQRESANTCGEKPMLQVPLVGRAVRIFGADWFTICAFCGCVTKLLPQNRFEAVVCCLRCDIKLLNIQPTKLQPSNTKMCRYCGKVDTNTVKWKVFKAPHDVSGQNKTLPPPMRTVTYCPKHTRPWLNTAHRVLHTRVILSHLAYNAKPIFSADKKHQEADLGFERTTQRRKRRRTC